MFQCAQLVGNLSKCEQDATRLRVCILTYATILDHADEPPIAVTVVEQYHGVAFGGIGLSLDRRDECMEGIHELEINVLYFS